VPLSGDEYEKEEFTLRYFLEYTKPYMLKHEIQPGFFLLLTQKGTGDFAQMGDVVTIDYVGRFAMDGKKFDDSSFNPDPFEFELGKPDQILKGLEKALYRMRLGSRAEVYFSSRYGYGAQGSSTGIVGKYKSLTFAVHLKKINKKQNELN
jgi:FKBP-type peptidyl-prolyl cis-trans isomerase